MAITRVLSSARRLGSFTVLAPLVLAVQVGLAQPEGRGGGGGGRMGGDMFRAMMEPAVNSRDLERYQGILGLDDDQKEIVSVLFDGYMEEFQAKAQEVRQKMEAAREQARESGDPGAWDGVRETTEQFQTARKKMETEFLGEIKAILNDQQAEKWPTFERTLRREQTMRGRGGPMFIAGERVDLVRLVSETELAEESRATVAPVLADYEADLDRELVARNEVYEGGMARMGEMMRGGDMEAMQAQMEKARAASMKVRDVNRRYARTIEGMLPDADRPEFADAFKRASYPDVYRTTRTSRLIEAVEKFEDLDAEQKAGVMAIKESYSRELDSLNEQLVSAIDQEQETFTVDRMFNRDRDSSPTGEIRRKRGDLDRSTGDKVQAVLTPGQQERLQTLMQGEEDRRRGGPEVEGQPRPRRQRGQQADGRGGGVG